MQNKDIELFLELVKTRNISKAAENMFISQSVISTRLKSLEDELGYALFHRARGIREIELTRPGREFVSVATRMHNLYAEAELLRLQTRYSLNIAAPESVYCDFLEELVLRIFRNVPELRLSVMMKDSSEVYDLMENGQIDFGFASYESSHSNIKHEPVFSQDECLVFAGEDHPGGDPVSPADLDPEKEIRLTGGNFSNVAQWRDVWFAGQDRCRIMVNSPHMIVKYLIEPGSWAILPLATARMLSALYAIRICELTDAPESRKIYLLRHIGANKGSDDAARIFEKELELYLEERKNNTTEENEK
ncbi:MAG: LysR family transcriptional regulator [Oscillospiraceae bacterium]|nr:LysR family transcriptional regulator [Oscillospiraceae bacterium]